MEAKKQRKCIGRINYVYATSEELYFLCILLNIVKGLCNYEEIKTVDDILYPIFQEACNTFSILDNDKEWQDALNQASQCTTPH